ncbi:ARMD4 protein, partial [Bucorvus abyssinicus]|nr:ARMD4 protein [Bucorvus abyssinicus]
LHSGLVSLAGFWAHYFSAMSRSLGFNICVVIYSILLLSSSPPCLASQPLEERDMTKVQHGPWAGNGVEDERSSMLTLKDILGSSEQTVSKEPRGVSAKPSEMPLTEVFTAEGERLPASPSHVISGSLGLRAHTSAVTVAAVDEEELGPTKSELGEDDEFKAMLTAAVTTLNPAVQEESVGGPTSETTTEGGEVEHSSASPSAKPLSGTAVEEKVAESNFHLSAVPQPTPHPSSPSWETASDHLVVPTPQAHGMTSEVRTPRVHTGSPLKSLVVQASVAAKHTVMATEASLHLEAGTDARQGELAAMADTVTSHPMDTVLPDWDDTKLGDVSQGGSTSHEEVTEDLGTTESSQTQQESVGEEENQRVLPSPVSLPPTPELALETNCTVPVEGEELPSASTGSSDALHTANVTGIDTADLNSLEYVNAVTAEVGKSILPSQPEAAVVTDTQSDLSPTLESSWKGVTQEVTTVAQETDAALSMVTLVPGATQGTGAASLLQGNSGEDTQMPTAPSATQMLVATGTSSMANTPDVEDVDLVTSENAVPAPGGLSATQSGQTEEPPSRTVVLVTPATMASSVRRTALPSVRRISTAVTYGLDRLESEEGEEEDEEEEEEEEEEEDEEDKDMDLMDESMEGDTELPGFTLPGETSQEPIAGLENPVAQLAGVSYQVPDTIEWEQQNQGLVRSWMEKLKDKAGYMSGMLVPVGVGIAGALFILGALYSIKIMNRRRRNGSKRHKRKQREFNSMQDRVMLLADSSEDEF